MENVESALPRLEEHKSSNRILNRTVIVSALGYFVDTYDLILFSIVRVSSLKALGIPERDILRNGIYLINMQMFGMLLGGILWGVLGDRRGRVSVLFGSILLYSVANVANGFVTSVEGYALCRFFAGIGLAGELGAAVTLVSEVMTPRTRGYGTSIVAGVGVLGAVVGALVGDMFSWSVAYITGGFLGLALLLLRFGIFESGMFSRTRATHLRRGRFLDLFRRRELFVRYLRSIALGLPTWFVIGILMTFSPELSKAVGVQGEVSAGKAIMFSYIGLSLGDLASGFLSQMLQARKRTALLFIAMTAVFVACYGALTGLSLGQFYFLCGILGFCAGYWAVFMMLAAEQFGTNLRATVTTTVPNFVRGAVVPITLGFQFLTGHVGLLAAAMTVGAICLLVSFVAGLGTQETYGRDLDFVETH